MDGILKFLLVVFFVILFMVLISPLMKIRKQMMDDIDELFPRKGKWVFIGILLGLLLIVILSRYID